MELEQVLARLADGARQTLQADATAVRLLEEGSARLMTAAVSGLPAALREQEPIAVEHSSIDNITLPPISTSDNNLMFTIAMFFFQTF